MVWDKWDDRVAAISGVVSAGVVFAGLVSASSLRVCVGCGDQRLYHIVTRVNQVVVVEAP